MPVKSGALRGLLYDETHEPLGIWEAKGTEKVVVLCQSNKPCELRDFNEIHNMPQIVITREMGVLMFQPE